MAAPSWWRSGTAETLNHLKKDYRARFCHGEGKKIDVRPGQNMLKLVQDCFENCGDDLSISSPSATRCSTPAVGEKMTWLQRQRQKARLTDSVKKACNSAESSPASPASSSKGWSRESLPKPAVHSYGASKKAKNVISKKMDSPVSKREINNILEAVDTLCQSPAMSSDSEDDSGAVGSPVLVKPASSPGPVTTSSVTVVFPLENLKPNCKSGQRLHFDDQNTSAAVKSHVEAENLKGPEAGRDEQDVLMQGTERIATSSIQKGKSFSSAVLAAVATGKLGKRYSSSISPSSPLVKDQEIEIENECEFLIDESDGASCSSWVSIPCKKKSKKNPSASPVSKRQPSKKTESKKSKNGKVQVEALTKQQTDDSDARELKGTSESDPVSNSAGKVLTSQKKTSTHMGKAKKGALRQGSPNQKKRTSSKPEGEELMSPSRLEAKAPDTEQCKTRVMPSESSPLPSAGHQQQQPVSPKKNLKSSKNPQLASKTSQPLIPKKQTAKQKLQKGKVAKRLAESPRKKLKKSVKKSNKKSSLQRQESSDCDSGEHKPEQEPVKLNEALTSPLHQELQTPRSQKVAESEKLNNVLHALESFGADNETLVKALHYLVDSVKNSGKKQLSAKSSGKIPPKIHHRRSEGACSSPEDTESQTPDSCFEQDRARKNQKLPDVKIKSKKRRRTMQPELQGSFAAEEAASHKSGPVLEHDVKMASGSKSRDQDGMSTDTSEELNSQIRALLSDEIARHKIVLPSNTPNVRRTKRIRLRPLEYWRGERINYAMSPTGSLVINGIVCPEIEPGRKMRPKKYGHSQKRHEKRSEISANLGQALADTSKPTVVLDPLTNEEILLECVNTEVSNSCFFKDETVEIYKNLNTSAFATGRLILKPLKEKGHQFVHMDTIAFHVIHGKIIATLHKTSYYLTTGDFFYVPAGNGYNIRNLLNEESVLLFTQLKDR